MVETRQLTTIVGKGQRVMGLDVGSKTIGVALSDTRLLIASPYETVTRKKFTTDAKILLAWAAKENVGGFIVGLPLQLDGSEGRRAQSVRQFIKNMEDRTLLPFALWDERLSTAAVERILLEADASRKRRGEVIDKMAAAYILQGALDALRRRQDLPA